MQLVDSAFSNAEQAFCSAMFPTPPTSPRQEVLPDDDDRVTRIKELLAQRFELNEDEIDNEG